LVALQSVAREHGLAEHLKRGFFAAFGQNAFSECQCEWHDPNLCFGVVDWGSGGIAIGMIIPLALGRHGVKITNVILEYITIVIRASKTSRTLFYF
jgi:hypothetical protein